MRYHKFTIELPTRWEVRPDPNKLGVQWPFPQPHPDVQEWIKARREEGHNVSFFEDSDKNRSVFIMAFYDEQLALQFKLTFPPA